MLRNKPTSKKEFITKKKHYLRLVGSSEEEVQEGNGKANNLLANKDFVDVVRLDLEKMVQSCNLAINPEIWRVLLVQSVHGHAQNGHGEFGKYARANDLGFGGFAFPTASIKDIIQAAGLRIDQTEETRQQICDQVQKWAEKAIVGKVSRLVIDGQPLLGANFLRNYSVDVKSTLKGMAFAGEMDSHKPRRDTVEEYKKTILGRELILGSGETYLVNAKKIFQMGIDYDFLATHEHTDEALNVLRDLEVIVKNKGGRRRITSAYLRRAAGAGTSDDLAFIMIGRLCGREYIEAGTSAMLGAFVMDATDTYDKLIKYPVLGGFDEALGQYIQDEWKAKHQEPLITPEDVRRIIYYSAKLNDPKARVSSSHRYLVQKTEQESLPTIINHISHVRGENVPKFPIGFTRHPSTTFYRKAQKRSKHMLEKLAA